MPKIRIQKYLSDIGFTSRRKAEKWVEQGLIKINGQTVTQPGSAFDPTTDTISLDKSLKQISYHYYLYHKPSGIVTVNAQAGEKEIKDLIQLESHVVPVGRLDKHSTGLILLTNDPVVSRRLMDPDFEHEKEYQITVDRPLTQNSLELLSKGVPVLGEKTKTTEVKFIEKNIFEIVLTEGKNRQIRRMCETLGYRVMKIHRVRIATLRIDRLKSGEVKKLNGSSIDHLKKFLKIQSPSLQFH